MIENVLFDLDGTLLDTTQGVIESVKYAIKKMGLDELKEWELLQFIGPPIQNSFMKFYGLSSEESQRAGQIFRDYYKTEALYLAEPYESIFDTCLALKKRGMKLAVATYKREDYAIDLLNHFGFGEIFDVMHGADNNNILKKEDIVNICMKEIGASNYNSVLIGDTIHDALGAQKAGVDFIAVTYGFGFKENSELTMYPNIGVAETTIGTLDIIDGYNNLQN